jgi:hypothetical protein
MVRIENWGLLFPVPHWIWLGTGSLGTIIIMLGKNKEEKGLEFFVNYNVI